MGNGQWAMGDDQVLGWAVNSQQQQSTSRLVELQATSASDARTAHALGPSTT